MEDNTIDMASWSSNISASYSAVIGLETVQSRKINEKLKSVWTAKFHFICHASTPGLTEYTTVMQALAYLRTTKIPSIIQ
jgi:hypothetical protein